MRFKSKKRLNNSFLIIISGLLLSLFSFIMMTIYARNFSSNKIYLNSKVLIPTIAGVSESGPYCIQ